MAFEMKGGRKAPGIDGGSGGLFPEIPAWKSFGIDLPMRVASELLNFAGRRLQAQADHVAALARSGSAEEAFKLQVAFVTQTLSDYQREAGTLSQEVADGATAWQARRAA